MKKILLIILAISSHPFSYATLWQVGATRTYTKPSLVSNLVQNGDTVEIDAGVYALDVARWSANNLLLKGVNGMAKLPSGGTTYGGKAIWVIAGDNTTVENIEFSEAACVDFNGAGIRQEGKNLTVRNCYFHHNEDGILAGTVNPSKILIEYSEFGYNGYGDGYSHNLYINHVDTLIFQYNYTHHCKVGHEIKSRANVNFILYNRISDEDTATASRSIDLPNGGPAYIIGNVIEQGAFSQNSNIIGYGMEGLSNPSPQEIFAINNTIVNNKSNGSFFQFGSGTSLFKAYNNIIAGPGNFVSGNYPTTTDTMSNLISTNISSFNFVNVSILDCHLLNNTTLANNAGTNPGSGNGTNLNPVMEYQHPDSAVARCVSGLLDIGAYEFCTPVTSISSTTLLKPKSEIYPNPAKNWIQVNQPENEIISLEIYSLEGIKLQRCDNNSLVDISQLPAGIYYLRINVKTKSVSKIFVKQD